MNRSFAAHLLPSMTDHIPHDSIGHPHGRGDLKLSFPGSSALIQENGAGAVFIPDAVRNKKLELDDITSKDEVMQEFLRQLKLLAKTDVSFLLSGETGTGKGVYARAVHGSSDRSGSKFGIIDCIGLGQDLIESELFGHTEGAFTGAGKARTGLLVDCDGGTAFVDEVTEMPLNSQGKFLRFLNEGQVRPVGDNVYLDLNVRVIAASNRDLEAQVQSKVFRDDLRWRLGTIIEVPPLRDRPKDLADMIVGGMQHYSKTLLRTAPTLDQEAFDALMTYHWPGNVRQLCNVLQALVLFHHGEEVGADVIVLRLGATKENSAPAEPRPEMREAVNRSPLARGDLTFRSMEHWLVETALTNSRGNRQKASEALGISVRTLQRYLSKNGSGTLEEAPDGEE